MFDHSLQVPLLVRWPGVVRPGTEVKEMVSNIDTFASVLGMLGSSSFSALVPEFQREWGLSNTDAGWINGIFYGGYVLAVPLLVGSTDRIGSGRGVRSGAAF